MSHSVHPETRELISTSVSAIQKFEDCPARWFHRYVLGEKEPFTGDQKAGVEGHAQAEHYLRTGEDVLGPTMRAGKHLLPAPNPLLRVEWGLNDKPKPPAGPDGKEIAYFPPEESLLQAAGVPLIGFMDFVNHTGVYTDPEGVIRDDPEGTIEVGDHKLTNDLKWAKPGASLIKTVQMAGYAEWCRQRFDGLTHVRLSHIYYKKKGAPAAKKETSIISLEQLKSDGMKSKLS